MAQLYRQQIEYSAHKIQKLSIRSAQENFVRLFQKMAHIATKLQIDAAVIESLGGLHTIKLLQNMAKYVTTDNTQTHIDFDTCLHSEYTFITAPKSRIILCNRIKQYLQFWGVKI